MATRDLIDGGTTLAPRERVKDASTDGVWRKNRDQFFVSEARRTSRTAIAMGVLVQAAVIAILIHDDYPSWRIVTLGGVYVTFAISHRFLIRGTADAHRVANAFIMMNVLAQLFVVGSATLTGGVHSPFVPGTVLPAIVSLLFFGPHAVSRWMALGNGLLILAMAFLPESVVGPAMGGGHYAAAVLVSLAWNLFMLHMMVGKLAIVANRAGESVACLRAERLTETEDKLQRLQSVGAKVAHELKNPLASIKGLCQLIARTPDSARTQERLTVVASEISRMETILGEYLSFSRPLEDLEPEAVDLSALGRDVLDVLAGRADQADVALAIEGGATKVQADPRRLKEALINLVSNAIEATPGGGKVSLHIQNGGANATIEVRDTGRGIAPDVMKRLGTSFFTTRPNGTGLGVVLAQGVIAQHGGQLQYASTVGKGTTATITLPCQVTAETTPRAAMIEARA